MKPAIFDQQYQEKLKKIRMLVLDVDGILTDTRTFWIENQGWVRHFSVRDGYGLHHLKKNGIELAVISAGEESDLKERIRMLGIEHFYLGSTEKLSRYEELLTKTGYQAEQTAYMGDDVFDIPVLQRVGFSATVPEAISFVKSKVDYITERSGGVGAVREVADGIRYAQDMLNEWETL